MKVSDLVESRQKNWQELEALCSRMERWFGRGMDAPAVARFSALYRSACADLALADAYQLPPGTIQYLHRLVGRAHNQLYRSRMFRVGTWARQLLVDVPQRLFSDNYLRLAFCVFWGIFLLSMTLAYTDPGYAERVAGEEMLSMIEEQFSHPMWEDPARAGFYIFNNAGIGLRCFAFGLGFGVLGLYITVYNAALLGAVFGHMAGSAGRENFFEFVTAHGPLELTAIVLSAAAGMQLGFSLVDTRGLTRLAALREGGRAAMPVMGAAIVLFTLAALIESSVSPAPLPYWVKALTAGVSAGLLVFYFVVLGYPRGE